MPTEKEVYTLHPSQYDRLILREDIQNNILKAIQKITPLTNNDVIDLGAGTGRLTRLLSPLTQSILAMDISPQMLQVAKDSLNKTNPKNWLIAAADNSRLPVKEQIGRSSNFRLEFLLPGCLGWG